VIFRRSGAPQTSESALAGVAAQLVSISWGKLRFVINASSQGTAGGIELRARNGTNSASVLNAAAVVERILSNALLGGWNSSKTAPKA